MKKVFYWVLLSLFIPYGPLLDAAEEVSIDQAVVTIQQNLGERRDYDAVAEASTIISRGLEVNPDDPELLLAAAQAMSLLNRKQLNVRNATHLEAKAKVLEAYRRVLEVDPLNLTAMVNYAVLKNDESSVAMLEKAVSLDGENALNQFYFGMHALRSGDPCLFEPAVSALLKNVELQPEALRTRIASRTYSSLWRQGFSSAAARIYEHYLQDLFSLDAELDPIINETDLSLRIRTAKRAIRNNCVQAHEIIGADVFCLDLLEAVADFFDGQDGTEVEDLMQIVREWLQPLTEDPESLQEPHLSRAKALLERIPSVYDDPDDVNAKIDHAYTLPVDEMIVALKSIIEEHPERKDVYYTLGKTYIMKYDDYESGLAYLKHAYETSTVYEKRFYGITYANALRMSGDNRTAEMIRRQVDDLRH